MPRKIKGRVVVTQITYTFENLDLSLNFLKKTATPNTPLEISNDGFHIEVDDGEKTITFTIIHSRNNSKDGAKWTKGTSTYPADLIVKLLILQQMMIKI